MRHMSGSTKTLGSVSFLVLGLSLGTIGLSGCDLTRNHLKLDRSGHMEMQDYRDALAPRIAEEDAIADAAAHDDSIPPMQAYVASPSEKLRAMPLVSISVNQTVPLRDALFELANQAGYDIELDPRIKGSVIFTARDKPFDSVIQHISEISGLRYKFDDDKVRVELDTPYHKTYKIDYLSYIRSNTSSIKNDVSVVSGEGANTGSKFEAASKSEADFWGELATNLTQVLGIPMANAVLTTKMDPTITAAPANPAPVEPVVSVGPNGEQIVQVTPPAATLQVQSLPTDPSQPVSPATVVAGQSPDGSSFSVNKQAGMLAVNATERQHRQIEEYMAEVKRSVTSQVLIEAKILEVSLNDEFSAGINWQAFENLIGEFSLGFTGSNGGLVRDILPDAVTGAPNFTLGYAGNDVNAVIDAASRFGTVKALASPRLTVLNNQSAVLNVASNRVYFEMEIETTQGTNGSPSQTNVDSQIKNVPEGVLINVQPSINLDDQSVSMSVRPTITRIVGTINDPAVAFVAQDLTTPITSPIPIVNIQEMDSVVKMNSGQALIMGGLMQDRTDSEQTGVPVLAEIPLLGSAFRRQLDSVSKTELIIFLKATIIESGDSGIAKADKDIYKRFSGDRRPLRM